MIRTIKQRIYVVGLLPLATLAVALLVINGLARIEEAHQELRNARNVTASLLQSPAADALLLGNTIGFEQTVKNVIKTSPLLVCVILRDAGREHVAQIGKCEVSTRVDYSPITVPAGGFSDFKEAPTADVTLGELGLAMNGSSVERKRRQVLFQLMLSLSLIAVVLALIGWLLRARLIEPIRGISSAMQSLSQRDYSARVPVQGDDELSRLAAAINDTIVTIASYTRELERRRGDADRALHDADEANLARDGLVRSLTEDVEGPLSQLHSELTAIAMANHDPALRNRIKEVIALLQGAQADFADLIEVAASTKGPQQPLPRDLQDILSDLERDIRLLSEAEALSVSFVISQMPADSRREEPTGILVDVDAVRLKKALVFLIRAMGRRCKVPGIHVTAELLTLSADQLHISIHLKAFYEPIAATPALSWLDKLHRYGQVPVIAGWTDRETRIIDYLLGAVGIEPTVSVSATGAASILLETTCHYTVEPAPQSVPADWSFDPHAVSATLVSNDLSLVRLTRRADLSSFEVKLMPFSRALANPSALRAEAALLIDMSDDVADAVRLLDQLKAGGDGLPHLIAICPPGRMSDSLDERLLELGFKGTLQKPLQYSRVVEAIRAVVSHPLKTIVRNGPPDQDGGRS